ncbi:hypothetical protein KC323_g156 [Hortaea werneckii]|nr:hypothetical protein KC323_g156 [Hortaea werneckii]
MGSIAKPDKVLITLRLRLLMVARRRAAGLGGSRKSGVRAGVKSRHGRPPSAREAGMEVPVPHYYCTDSVAGKRGEAVCAYSQCRVGLHASRRLAVSDVSGGMELLPPPPAAPAEPEPNDAGPFQWLRQPGSPHVHTYVTAPVAHSAQGARYLRAQTSLPLDCHPPHSPIKAAVRTSLPSSSSNPPITDYQSTRPVLTQASTAASQSVGDLLAYLAILKRCRRVFLLATGSAPTPPEDADIAFRSFPGRTAQKDLSSLILRISRSDLFIHVLGAVVAVVAR